MNRLHMYIYICMYLCITIYTYIQDYIHIIEKEKINRTRSPPVVHQATEHAPGTSTKASVDFATGTTGENGFDASGSSLVFHMPHFPDHLPCIPPNCHNWALFKIPLLFHYAGWFIDIPIPSFSLRTNPLMVGRTSIESTNGDWTLLTFLVVTIRDDRMIGVSLPWTKPWK